MLKVHSEVLGSAAPLTGYLTDVHLTIEIRSEGARRVGVLFRHRERKAGVLVLDFDTGQAHVGTTEYDPFSGAGFVPLDSFRLGLKVGQIYRLRIFLRDEHLEAYLDDRWIFSSVLDVPPGGELMLYAEGGKAAFESLRVAAIEPFPEF